MGVTCDLCSMRDIPLEVIWTYVLPQEAMPQQDNQWAVCPECHEILQSGEAKPTICARIVQRNHQSNAGVILGDEDGELERVMRETQAVIDAQLIIFTLKWSDHWRGMPRDKPV